MLYYYIILYYNFILPVCWSNTWNCRRSLFCKYVVEIPKIETALFTNKWIQVSRIRTCAFCGYQYSPWRDICGFCNQENGHWNQAFSFSLDRHRYLVASHCYTKLKLDGWLRLGSTHYLFSWTSPCMLVHRQTFSGWSWKLVPTGTKGSTQDTEKGSIEHCGGWHTGYEHLRLGI